jgi:hypothetical protein
VLLSIYIKFSCGELSDPAVNSIVKAGVQSKIVSQSDRCKVKSPHPDFSILIVIVVQFEDTVASNFSAIVQFQKSLNSQNEILFSFHDESSQYNKSSDLKYNLLNHVSGLDGISIFCISNAFNFFMVKNYLIFLILFSLSISHSRINSSAALYLSTISLA